MSEKSITISKKGLIIIAFIVALLIAGAVTVTILIKNRSTEAVLETTMVNGVDIDPNAGEFTGAELEDKSEDAQPGIKIPGYPSITIKKDTKDVSVALLNPEGNPCYFKFELCLKDTGEVLYTSKLVPPGKAITEISMSKALAEGSYDAVIKITTTSLTDGSAMNGANVETVLIAK